MSNKMKMMVVLAVFVFAIIGLAAFTMFNGYDVIQMAGDCVASTSVCTGLG